MEAIHYSLKRNVCTHHLFCFRAKPREKYYQCLNKSVQGQTANMMDSRYGNPNGFTCLALRAHQRLLRA